MWDINSGKEVQQFQGNSGWVTSAAFSPNSKYVVTGSQNRSVRLWETSTGIGKQVQELAFFSTQGYPDSSLTMVTFSPDGRYVLGGDDRGMLLLWEVQSGKVIQELHTGATSAAAAFSPDGKFLLTTLSNELTNAWGAEIWDVVTGKPLRFFKGHTSKVTSVGFSADGKYLITGSLDKSARLWDAQTGKELRRFNGHTDVITAIGLSPDVKQLTTASLDNTVRVWDAQTGQELRRFDGAAIGARRVTFSSDGRFVLASHADNSVSMWPIDYHDTVKSVCKRLLRDLTEGERVQYGIRDKTPTCPK